MRTEQILSHEPRVLTQAQRESYFADGYVVVEALISEDWLARLNRVTESCIERSRSVTASNDVFDVAPGHSAEAPMVRRIKRPDAQDPAYWEFARDVLADVAADVVGPNVTFHHSKLNFKWNDGSDEVKWHQDAQFYPHTNYSPLTIGTYLHDTGMVHGPLAVLPGSHDGPLFDQYDAEGSWVGHLSPSDAAALDTSNMAYLEGPAGSITIHNCRTVHSSSNSTAPGGRPLLLNAFTSADAFAYTPHPDPSENAFKIVRGGRPRWSDVDPRPCQIPPDWSGGYTSIFAAQAGEDQQAG